MQLKAGLLQASVLAGEVLHLQNHIAWNIVLGGKAVGQLRAHHQTDDLIHGQFLGRAGGYPLTVPHDGDIVADAENFLHLMADVNNAAALAAQHIDNAEQMFHLHLGQRRGGLVKYDHLGVIADGLGNLHHLPLANWKRGHDGSGVHMYVKLLKNFLSPPPHDALADHDAAHLGVATQPQIVRDGAGQGLV